jgi:BRCT domain type II-containing protein
MVGGTTNFNRCFSKRLNGALHWRKHDKSNAGKLISSLLAKVDFLDAGENLGPAKLEKAQKPAIKIISEQDFIDLLP